MAISQAVIAIGGSEGGIDAISNIVNRLPASIPAALLAVLHIGDRSVLSSLFQRRTQLKVPEVKQGMLVERGHLYIAPPSFHMEVNDGRISLNRKPKENNHRPAIDHLFRSVAREYRNCSIGVILTGNLDDGSAGLFSISSKGGKTVIQDPNDALVPAMPSNALRYAPIDYCVPLLQIPDVLTHLAATIQDENGNSKHDEMKTYPEPKQGKSDIAPFVCPDCSGPLTHFKIGELDQFQCEVGHRFSPHSLNEAQNEALERALWIAVRSLKDKLAIDKFALSYTKTEDMNYLQKLNEEIEKTSKDIRLIQQILEKSS